MAQRVGDKRLESATASFCFLYQASASFAQNPWRRFRRAQTERDRRLGYSRRMTEVTQRFPQQRPTLRTWRPTHPAHRLDRRARTDPSRQCPATRSFFGEQ